MGLPHAFRVRAGDDQAAAPATEEIRQEAERPCGSLLLYQVAAAWGKFVGCRRRARRTFGPLARDPLMQRMRDRVRGPFAGRTRPGFTGGLLRDPALRPRR